MWNWTRSTNQRAARSLSCWPGLPVSRPNAHSRRPLPRAPHRRSPRRLSATEAGIDRTWPSPSLLPGYKREASLTTYRFPPSRFEIAEAELYNAASVHRWESSCPPIFFLQSTLPVAPHHPLVLFLQEKEHKSHSPPSHLEFPASLSSRYPPHRSEPFLAPTVALYCTTMLCPGPLLRVQWPAGQVTAYVGHSVILLPLRWPRHPLHRHRVSVMGTRPCNVGRWVRCLLLMLLHPLLHHLIHWQAVASVDLAGRASVLVVGRPNRPTPGLVL
jgi:hypothetical protein